MKKILVGLLILVLFWSSAVAIEMVRQKNAATVIYYPIVDADGDFVASATGLDSEIDAWTDAAVPDGFTDCTNEATAVGATGWYRLSLSATEMNTDYIAIQTKTTSAGAKTQAILIRTIVGDPLLVATTSDGGTITLPTNFSSFALTAGGAVTVGTNSDKTGYGLADDAITAAKIAASAIGASEIAADAITSSELAATAATEIATAANGIPVTLQSDSLYQLVLGKDSVTTALHATNKANFKATGYAVAGDMMTLGEDSLYQLLVGKDSVTNAIHATNKANFKATGYAVKGDPVTLQDDSLYTLMTAAAAIQGKTDSLNFAADPAGYLKVDVVEISSSSDAADYLEEAFDGDSTVTGAKLELEQLYINPTDLGGSSEGIRITSDGYGIYVEASAAEAAYFKATGVGDDGVKMQGSGTGASGLIVTGAYGFEVTGTTRDMILGNTGNIQGSIDSANAVGVGGDGLTQHSIKTEAAAELADSTDDRVRASALDVNVASADVNSYDSADFKPEYWSAIASHSDSGTSGTGLDSATTSRLLHRVVWGQQKGTSGSSDSSAVTARTILKSYSAGAATVDTATLTVWATRNYDTDGDGYLLAELGGAGTRTVTVTVKDTSDSSAISGFDVAVYDSSSDEYKARISTNSNGVATFSLDDETYTVHLKKTPYYLATPRYFIVAADMESTFYASAFDAGSPASASMCRIYINDIRDLGAVEQEGYTLKAVIPSKYYPVTVGDAIRIPRLAAAVSNNSGYVYLDVYRSTGLTAGDGSSTVKYDLLLLDTERKEVVGRMNVEIPDAATWEIDWTP